MRKVCQSAVPDYFICKYGTWLSVTDMPRATCSLYIYKVWHTLMQGRRRHGVKRMYIITSLNARRRRILKRKADVLVHAGTETDFYSAEKNFCSCKTFFLQCTSKKTQ